MVASSGGAAASSGGDDAVGTRGRRWCGGGGLSGRSGGYARWPQAVVWWPPIAGFRWAMVQRRGAAWEVGRPQQLLVPPPIPLLVARGTCAVEMVAPRRWLRTAASSSGVVASNGGDVVVGNGPAAGGCLGGWVASAAPHPPPPLAHGSVVGCARRLWRYGGQVVE
jgi:hypothetical protein